MKPVTTENKFIFLDIIFGLVFSQSFNTNGPDLIA